LGSKENLCYTTMRCWFVFLKWHKCLLKWAVLKFYEDFYPSINPLHLGNSSMPSITVIANSLKVSLISFDYFHSLHCIIYFHEVVAYSCTYDIFSLQE
jgi:hypothetical protein